jgi:tetratricopeptide (TPR) repeat protein
LLWLVLRKLRIPGSWLAALLFGVHPVCVASVAWIAELKNTLSMLFYLAALLCWLRSEEPAFDGAAVRPTRQRFGWVEQATRLFRSATRRPESRATDPGRDAALWPKAACDLPPGQWPGGTGESPVPPKNAACVPGEEGNPRFDALALVLFLLALLAKVSVAVLPVVLLLLAWWRRGRISRRDWARTAPFFILAVALGLFGMTFQNQYTALNDSLPARLLGGSWAVWFYLWKIFWPVHLTIIYPRWNFAAASPAAWIPGICFAAMLFVFWRKRAGWGRPLFFAAAYFVIALAPVLGLFKLVYLYFSQAADHLQYLALPGIVALAVAGGWHWFGRSRALAYALGASLAAVLSVLTWQNQGRFADMSSLWRDNLARNPASFQALIFVGAEEESRGQYEEAGVLFRRALAVRPESPEANVNLGIVLDDQGRTEEAIVQAEKALRLKPGDADALLLLARLLEKKGLTEDAAQHLREAIRLAPDDFRPHQNLGNLLVTQGRLDEAIQQFGEALKLKFDDPALFVALGNAQGRRGDLDAALACFQKALSLDTNSADARKGLAVIRQLQAATNAPRP